MSLIDDTIPKFFYNRTSVLHILNCLLSYNRKAERQRPCNTIAASPLAHAASPLAPYERSRPHAWQSHYRSKVKVKFKVKVKVSKKVRKYKNK